MPTKRHFEAVAPDKKWDAGISIWEGGKTRLFHPHRLDWITAGTSSNARRRESRSRFHATSGSLATEVDEYMKGEGKLE